VTQACAAHEAGLIEARGILDLVETADNAELRSTVANYIHSFIRLAERTHATVVSLQQFLAGGEVIAHAQYTAELKLLSRIDELGKDAGAEALSKLAGAYAALRSVSVAPGVYEPDDHGWFQPVDEDFLQHNGAAAMDWSQSKSIWIEGGAGGPPGSKRWNTNDLLVYAGRGVAVDLHAPHTDGVDQAFAPAQTM
jgi:hypothetical protein